MRRVLAFALFGLAACSREPPPTTPATPDAAAAATPTRTPKALRALWRDSIRYRKAHEARAHNRLSFEADRAKLDRMLTEVEAYARCPVTKDPKADAESVRTWMESYVTLFTPGATVTVGAGPAPATPLPTVAKTTKGYDYADDQVAGHHLVTVEVAAQDGPAFVKGLQKQPRLLELTSAETKGARLVFSGRVAWFRDFAPVRFVRPDPDVEARITRAIAGAPPEGAVAKKADQIRANYAAVDALQADLDASLEVSAALKVREARWRFYKAYVDRFNAATWAKLSGEKGGKEPARHPH